MGNVLVCLSNIIIGRWVMWDRRTRYSPISGWACHNHSCIVVAGFCVFGSGWLLASSCWCFSRSGTANPSAFAFRSQYNCLRESYSLFHHLSQRFQLAGTTISNMKFIPTLTHRQEDEFRLEFSRDHVLSLLHDIDAFFRMNPSVLNLEHEGPDSDFWHSESSLRGISV